MSEVNRLSEAEKTTKPNTWLNEFRRSITSQNGEDGIIEKVLSIINDSSKWCVEFGSWDGKTCSNTFSLIDKHDYSAVLIEGDTKRFQDLLKTYGSNKKVVPINTFVGFEKSNCLDSILQITDIPPDFDLLSIDVDGNDFHIWKAVADYKPKIVVIEFNPTIPNTVEFIQPADMQFTQGSSLLSISKLAKSKGYELVAATNGNGIFVDSKYFGLFGISDNSVKEMWTDESVITHLFCGYDGTVFIRGYGKILWNQIPYSESKMQHLPKWAIKRARDGNIIRRKLGKYYRRFRKKHNF